MTSIQNHIEFRLRGSLLSNGTTVNITNDIERDQVISATNAYVTLRDLRGDLVERMKVNMAGGVMTIVLRGLDQSPTDTEVASLRRDWRDGTRGFITVLAVQQADKNGENDFQGNNSFTGNVDFNEAGDIGTLTVPRMTTAERDAIVSPVDGMIIYNTTLGIGQQRVGGSRQNLGGGGVVADASTTVAGKVQIPTQTQHNNGDTTGSTGALLTPTPAVIQAGIQSGSATYAGASATGNDSYVVTLTPAITSYTEGMRVLFKADVSNTGACTININGVGVSNIKTLTGRDPENGNIRAGHIAELVYDGTNFVLQNPVEFGGSFVATAGENIDTGDVVRMGINESGQTILQNSTNGDAEFGHSSSSTAAQGRGQTFTITSAGKFDAASIWARSSTNPNTSQGNLECRIYTSPGGSLLEVSSTTIVASTLPSSISLATKVTFSFSGNLILNTGEQYYFEVIKTSSSGGVRADLRENTGPYAGGNAYIFRNNGDRDSDPDDDLRFEVVLGAVTENTSRVYKASASTSVTSRVVGVSGETVTTGNNAAIDLLHNNGQTGLNSGVDYYLSDTLGEISSTPGNTSVLVGRAVSDTSIVINPV